MDINEHSDSFSGYFISPKIKVKGKFLYEGNDKFYLKGVTYGTFAPGDNEMLFPASGIIAKDFSLMVSSGINCIRTYTVPPVFLLDLALKFNLKVMVGLAWEQHITFLDDKKISSAIIEQVKKDVESCQMHPAVLCYVIGNEIPANIVRWYGKHKIERFLKKLYKTVKKTDPDCLVTYVNYPTTEYLNLGFLDFDCFNVYLESPEKLSSYISRLHNLAGDRPLVLAEIGLDSMRNGQEKQAEVLQWQIEIIYGKGCAGMFVFAWTDEWWRGGFEIKDWDFGIVDRERNPKPALKTVSNAMQAVPFNKVDKLPFISVVVCSYNGSATIRETLKTLLRLDYPEYEVIVVNDGSTDYVPKIIKNYPYKIINTPNRGLSNARNTGLYNSKGEIIAYIDDDAYPDPHWLRYLAYTYATTNHAGVGGPNIVPPEDGPIAVCVANAPGGPVHVLSTDEIAEHIPGCNMSFRREALLKIGGCDPVFRSAGDDVDLCWRIQQAGYTIGFHPAAVVWHHRRNSLKNYWKQQMGYGKAEALLEAKWPEKYNGFGHLAWSGRIYGNGWTLPIKTKKNKIFHGTWGSALFQSVYKPADGLFNCLPLMPEWYLFTLFFGITGLLGFLWAPLFWSFLLFSLSLAVIFIQAAISASKNSSLPSHYNKPKYKFLIIFLHIIQPIARLKGRIQHGLTPWRKRGKGVNFKYLFSFQTSTLKHWSENWKSPDDWLSIIEKNLVSFQMTPRRGGDFDNWDIQTGNKLFSSVKALLTIEEHGAGKQYLKLRCKPVISLFSLFGTGLLTFISVVAAINGIWLITGLFGFLAFSIFLKSITELANSMNSLSFALINEKLPINAPVIAIERQFDLSATNGKKGKFKSRFKLKSLMKFGKADQEVEENEDDLKHQVEK